MIDYVKTWETIIDIIWLIQMVKTFTTPYIKDVEVKDKCTQIAYKYITGYFFLDVVSTCFTLFSNYSRPEFYYLKLLRLLYLLQATKIVVRLLDPCLSQFNIRKQKKNMILDIINILYYLFALMHIIACVWILLGDKKTEDQLTWKDTAYMNEEQKSNPVDIYIFSLYWVVTTLTTVGYGDMYAMTIGGKLVPEIEICRKKSK